MKTKRYSKEWKRKVSRGWFKKGSVPWNKGISMSDESKIKLSNALKGKKPWNKGKPTPERIKKKLSALLKGRRRSPETEFKKGEFSGNKNPAKRKDIRIKISKAKKGKPHLNQRGENHPRWKGGLSSPNELFKKSLKYKIWRNKVFTRDNWTCQKCKQRRSPINAHHIHNFSQNHRLRISLNNGVTLCKTCHRDFHKKYGIKDNSYNQLQRFLNN